MVWRPGVGDGRGASSSRRLVRGAEGGWRLRQRSKGTCRRVDLAETSRRRSRSCRCAAPRRMKGVVGRLVISTGVEVHKHSATQRRATTVSRLVKPLRTCRQVFSERATGRRAGQNSRVSESGKIAVRAGRGKRRGPERDRVWPLPQRWRRRDVVEVRIRYKMRRPYPPTADHNRATRRRTHL
jgi:hypothetical protein